VEKQFKIFLKNKFNLDTVYFQLDEGDQNYELKFSSEALGTCEISRTQDKITGIPGPVRRFIRTINGLPLLYEKKSSFEFKYEGVYKRYSDQSIKVIDDELFGQIKGAI